ncbi:hypothetical protein NFX46_16905 [Streptomyces phaeoluteigriseus]|uniref:Baseplate protein J-like domain-containing protein n=1 Tax=Streptomyces phaeoluteigriseus TaxID=114686 RepID=A0ABY4Z8N3_9ACTN|nr:hypothetical protein [Streptomyces phaeoluteigriseus]USQ85311.1 hypothetical protein NFX46_16905 [Streptomyces phaeoluteigriseus]
MNEILWIAVPAGRVTDDRAPLRVLVVPKLDTATPQPLSTFGLQDWPQTLTGAQFTVERAPDAASTVTAVTGLTPLTAPDSDLWRSFFPAATTVEPTRRRTYDAPVVSPSATDAARVRQTYTLSAQAIADPVVEADPVLREQYARWTAEQPAAVSGQLGPEEWRAPDFGRTVSLLREHPAVLTRLGLILEFALDAATIPVGSQLVRVRCALTTDLPGDWSTVTPWTRFTYDQVHFVPAPAPDSDLRTGMVDLTGTTQIGTDPDTAATWSVATFDVAGGVDRLRDGARSITDDESGVTLPVLRSAGLALLRNGRGTQLGQRAANAQQPLQARELTADDLVLGYRVDIRQASTEGQTGQWFPVCERTATYRVGDRQIGPAAQVEEGHVKAAAAVIGTDRVLRADEVVTRWSGWSLVLPHPVFDERGPVPSTATRLPLPFDFHWDFGLPERRLGELRFGQGYQMRIRVADMAGGGLRFDDLPSGSNRNATDLVLYRRHEPIPPPEFAPPPNAFHPQDGQMVTNPAAFGPGGSLDCLVIRSDPEGTTALDLDQFAAAHTQYPRNDRRILLPPPTSMTLAEQHGRLSGTDVEGNAVDDAVVFGWVQRAVTPPTATEDGDYSWLADPAAVSVLGFLNPGPDAPAPGENTDSAWQDNWPDYTAKTLELQDRREPGQPVIEWQGETLVVRLAPGEQTDLELSSRADASKIDQFEIQEWVPNAAEASLAAGRHPMLTPPRTVRLVHAVRRPLAVPAAALRATREVAATWATLADPAPGRRLFGIDRKSTGQVDVAAQWHEPGDTDTPGPLLTEQVCSIPVAPDATELTVRHEFGDTRHRRVTYSLTALSRFRQFFVDGEDTAFRHDTTLAEAVSILSSAPPVAPVVLAASPSFRWEGSADLSAGPVRRTRRGGRIRVELARPWNLSGEGEQLAVLTGPGLTRVSRDPIWTTGDAAGTARPDMFAGTAGTAAQHPLPGTGTVAQAVPYAPHPHAETDRWYADIELPGAVAGSYSPFVRLALARYQPESLPGCALSNPVTTDFVQLMPDRTLSVQRLADGLQVQLTGTGPLGPTRNRVTALVEECSGTAGSDLTSAAPDVAGLWHRVPGHAVSGALGDPLVLALPASGGRLRVVVRETEDIEPAVTGDDGTLSTELRQRTVFIDVVTVE